MANRSLFRRALGITLLVALIGGMTPLLPIAVEEAGAQVLDEGNDLPGAEIVELRSERSKTFEGIDGSRTARFYTQPVHFLGASGAWEEIDTTLVPSARSGYAWRNQAGSFEAHFAANASSQDMVLVTDATSTVVFGFEGASAASVGIVDGSTITYPDVKPGMDLVYEVRNGEVKEFIILDQPPTEPLTLDFPLTLTNLVATEDGSGGLELVTAAGDPGFLISDLWMKDSATDPASGETGFSENVQANLLGSGAAPTVRVAADQQWLTAPERVYPVTIDPTLTKSTNDDTYIQSNICCTDVSGENEMKSGTYDSGTTKARSLMKFADVQNQIPTGATIDGAKLYVWEMHSWSCTPRDVSVHRIADSWTGSSVRWSNQPGVAAAARTVNVAKGFSSSCAAGWVEFDQLGDVVRYWKNNNVNYGLEIRSPNETNNDWWKKWRTKESVHIPYLDVIYTEAETIPPPAPSVSSSTHPSPSSWYSSCAPSFSWTTPSDASGIEGYSYKLDQVSNTSVDNNMETTGNSVSYGTQSPEGTWWFHIRAKDNAGNWGTEVRHFQLNMDCSAPTTPSLSSSTHPSQTTWSASNAPCFSFSSSDSLSSIAGYSYELTTNASLTPDTTSEGTGTSRCYSGVADGTWHFRVHAKNGAGSWSSVGSYTVKIDYNAAVPSISSTTHGSPDAWYASRDPSFNWSASDESGIAGYSYVRDQSAATTPDTTSEGTGTASSYSGLADGEHYFHVRALNGAGKWGDAAHRRVRIDGSPPPAPSLSSSSHSSPGAWSNNNDPGFSFSSADMSGIDAYSYVLDQFSLTAPDTIADSASNSTAYTDVADGTWFFHVRARNGSGLWGDASHYQVNIDSAVPATPVISSPSHPDEALTYTGNDPSFAWSASDNLSGVAGYSYVLDQASTTTPDTTSEGTATSKSYSDLADGT